MLTIRPAATFAFFVLWLVAFTMSGFLLPAENAPRLMSFFLLPHTLSLLLLSTASRDIFARLFTGSVLLTTLFTVLFPHLTLEPAIILAILGITAAPLVIGIMRDIQAATDPSLAAGIGLAGANIMAFVLLTLAPGDTFGFLVVGLPLLLALLPTFNGSRGGAERTVFPLPEAKLRRYLPFIYLFYLTGGLMFGFIAGQYAEVSYAAGGELLVYVAATLGGILIIRWNRDLTLALGILLCMLAFSLLQAKTPLTLNLSMFANQAAFGLTDLFLVFLITCFANTIRAAGQSLGIMVFAILSGSWISGYFQEMTGLIIAAGNIVLTFAVLALYFMGWWRQEPAASIAGAHQDPAAILAHWEASRNRLHKQLSEKEKSVLALVLEGKTYKETAAALTISQSSVKTYMKRAYEKTGAENREELVRLLTESPTSAPPPR